MATFIFGEGKTMSYTMRVLEQVIKRNPNEPEFHQAVTETLTSLQPYVDANP